jgi:hypothetical protein
MKLRPRLVITSLAVAIPTAILLYMASEWLRTRDMRLALERFVASQMTDDTRDRCTANPNWFLAGPRPDRPSPEVLAAPDADAIAPRPPTQNVPFEYFAYDEAFTPLSSAGPRFPADLRLAIRRGANVATAPFPTNLGTGLQQAILTGWTRSPCAALLFRMWPPPGRSWERLLTFLTLLSLLVAVALVSGGPIVWRIRQLGLEARQSASDEYRSSVTVGGRDEMSALAFAFNEAASDIRRRSTDVRDREESLRRYIAGTTSDVTSPLIAAKHRLGRADLSAAPASLRAEIHGAVADVHTLSMRLQNLSTAATLRMSMESAMGRGRSQRADRPRGQPPGIIRSGVERRRELLTTSEPSASCRPTRAAGAGGQSGGQRDPLQPGGRSGDDCPRSDARRTAVASRQR